MKYLSAIIITVLLCSCSQKNTSEQEVEVYKDSVATRFFRRTSGWIASDGALSVALADGRTLWLMGDSHIDDYDTVTGTIPCLFQVRNAALLQPANSWSRADTETLTGDGPGIKSLFKTKADDNYWFWPGNGIQLRDTVYIYCSELKREGEGTFGFSGTGKDVWAKMKFPEMYVAGYDALPDFDGIHFGAGFIKDENSEYVYAYGQKLIPMAGESEVYLARFPEDNPGLPWEFWNGSNWNKDVADVAAIGRAAISPHVSKVNGKYLLLSTQLSVACDQGKEIYASVSEHPAGPFSEKKELYTIDDTLQGHYPFFYSVAAHPQFLGSNMPDLNGEEELLITYCINGYAPCLEPCPDGRANPDYYRPRGIRVPLERITAIAENDRKTTGNFNIDFTVEEAPEWTALFDRASGWIGADGIFTIPVNGVNKAGSADSTLFIFSDTMIGEIEGDELQPGWTMVNNSVGYLRGNEAREDSFRLYWDKNDEDTPRALFIPDTPSAEKGDYYWLGDGFINVDHNNATYIITYNAKAHPALSRPGELLISYNVNAFDFLNEIKKNPNLYRPRFIRVRFENEN